MPLGATIKTSPADNATSANNVDRLKIDRVYSGEVLLGFISTNVMEKYVTVKTLLHGISMRFPVIGVGKKEDVKTHTRGTEIDVNTKSAGEKVIAIGDVEYDSVFIDNKDAKVLDFDVTAPFTKNLGQSLAQKLDFQLLKLLPIACHDNTKKKGEAGQADGGFIVNKAVATTRTAVGSGSKKKGDLGDVLIDTIFDANLEMDKRNVPKDNRIFITTPDNWYAISRSDQIRNKDFTTENGGIDSFNMEVIKVGNTKVISSNNIYGTGKDGVTDSIGNAYEGFLFTKEAIGMVKFISMITESEYQMLRMGDVILSKYCYGADVLNPACVVGVRSDDAAIS